jgi:hypothetical protein
VEAVIAVGCKISCKGGKDITSNLLNLSDFKNSDKCYEIKLIQSQS